MLSRSEVIEIGLNYVSPIHFGAVKESTDRVYHAMLRSLGNCGTCEFRVNDYLLCDKLAIKVKNDFFCSEYKDKYE